MHSKLSGYRAVYHTHTHTPEITYNKLQDGASVTVITTQAFSLAQHAASHPTTYEQNAEAVTNSHDQIGSHAAPARLSATTKAQH